MEGPRYDADRMSPVAAIMSMFRQYAKFSGRASRAEFWWAFLFVAVLHVIPAVARSTLVLVLIWVPLAVPFLAVTARRLHDTSKSKQFVYVLLGASLALLGVVSVLSLLNALTFLGWADAVLSLLWFLMVEVGLLMGAYLVAGLILMAFRADMEEHRSIMGAVKLPGLSILLLVAAGGVWIPLTENRIVFGPYEAERTMRPIFTESLVWGLLILAVLVVFASFLVALLVRLESDSDPEPNRHGPSLLPCNTDAAGCG